MFVSKQEDRSKPVCVRIHAAIEARKNLIKKETKAWRNVRTDFAQRGGGEETPRESGVFSLLLYCIFFLVYFDVLASCLVEHTSRHTPLHLLLLITSSPRAYIVFVSTSICARSLFLSFVLNVPALVSLNKFPGGVYYCLTFLVLLPCTPFPISCVPNLSGKCSHCILVLYELV